jgi:hypothetical protein
MMRHDQAAAAVLQADDSLGPADDAGFQVLVRLVVQQEFIMRECLAEPGGDAPALGNVAPGGAGAQMPGFVRASIVRLVKILREICAEICLAGGGRCWVSRWLFSRWLFSRWLFSR